MAAEMNPKSFIAYMRLAHVGIHTYESSLGARGHFLVGLLQLSGSQTAAGRLHVVHVVASCEQQDSEHHYENLI